jgi:hypothetical protein
MRRAVRSLVLLALVTSTACSKDKRREPEPAAPDPNAPISAGGGPIDEVATPVSPDPESGQATPPAETPPAETTPPEAPPAEVPPAATRPVDSRPARPTRPASTPDATDAPDPRGDRPAQPRPGDETDESVEVAGDEKPAAGDPMYQDGAKPNIPQKPRKPRSGGSGSPAQGQPCADGHCAPGLRCVEYYGIAGPRGPAFSSCEIQCPGGKGCPAGQHCTTISDGPGQVCRPGS